MEKKIGFFVIGDSTKCTGCRACELACFTVHDQKENHVGKTAGTVSVPVVYRLFLTSFEEGCMPVQCRHCEDAPCLNACLQKAISRVDHQVIVHPEKCIGCKDCMQACPFGAIALLPYCRDGHTVAQAGAQEARIFASKCDLCQDRPEGPSCVQVCPHQALRLVDPEKEREEKNIRAAQTLYLTRNSREGGCR